MATGTGGKNTMGAGTQGKGSGAGGMSGDADIPENMVLSNRDKAQHPEGRGMDGKAILTEQFQDHAANRLPEEGQ